MVPYPAALRIFGWKKIRENFVISAPKIDLDRERENPTAYFVWISKVRKIGTANATATGFPFCLLSHPGTSIPVVVGTSQFRETHGFPSKIYGIPGEGDPFFSSSPSSSTPEIFHGPVQPKFEERGVLV